MFKLHYAGGKELQKVVLYMLQSLEEEEEENIVFYNKKIGWGDNYLPWSSRLLI